MEIKLGIWRIAIEQLVPSDSELSETYDRVSINWHQSIRRLGFLRAYAAVFEQIEHKRPFSNQLTVLDVGIGSGALSEALVRCHGGTFALSGVDISHQMLAQARHNLQRVGIRPYLSPQDVRQLPFNNNQFDLVMGAHVLEHLPDAEAGLQEMVRTLKPGAPLLLIMTRRSLASTWLHLNWAITPATDQRMLHMMHRAGLQNCTLIKLGGPLWCHWMSIAAIGWK